MFRGDFADMGFVHNAANTARDDGMDGLIMTCLADETAAIGDEFTGITLEVYSAMLLADEPAGGGIFAFTACRAVCHLRL